MIHIMRVDFKCKKYLKLASCELRVACQVIFMRKIIIFCDDEYETSCTALDIVIVYSCINMNVISHVICSLCL